MNGLGRHQYYLTASQKRMHQAIVWGDSIQSFIILGLTKTSICHFLKRIVDSSRVKFFLWGLITFLVLFTTIEGILGRRSHREVSFRHSSPECGHRARRYVELPRCNATADCVKHYRSSRFSSALGFPSYSYAICKSGRGLRLDSAS